MVLSVLEISVLKEERLLVKSALGLIALLIVWAGEVSVGRGAIAQSLPIPVTKTSETAIPSTGAANLSGTQGRQINGQPIEYSTPVNKPNTGEAPPAQTAPPQHAISETLKLELHLSERRLLAYEGEMLIADYPVAVGREGWQTPTGEFSVFQKQTDPTWEHPFTGELVPPGPENPLGSRGIGFWSDGQNSIGFHGTPDESVIGSAVSHGCVRMRDEDVKALYELVSIDTLVVVLP